MLWIFILNLINWNFGRCYCSFCSLADFNGNFLFASNRGFSGTYVKEYIETSNPVFAIGEYWDSLAYEHGSLCYNQGYYLLLVDSVILNVLRKVEFELCL